MTEVLEALISAKSDPVLVVDPVRDVLVFANPAARSFFGARLDEAATGTMRTLYGACIAQLHIATEAALEQGCYYASDLQPDGSTAMDTVEHQLVAIKTADGPLLMITIADLEQRRRRSIDHEANNYHRQGLEEWRRAERFFREIERENQLILAAAGEGIFGVNADGVTTFVNPAAQAMLGWKADDLVGKNMHAMVHYKHPDGSHYHGSDCPIYGAFRNGTINTVEDECFWRKDGSPIRVEYTSTPIEDDGALVGAVIVFRDISQRKQNEAQLREAMAENARLRERLEMENAYLQEEILSQSNHYDIIGSSSLIRKILKQIDLVAPTDANVLITGESGTGKELVARAIHQASHRSERPLIRVNCAAIPRELFESEFFGHVKGAFTGALRDRIGRFELANGGTIFLDEVGEIPLDLQSKLLRVVQDRRFERLGEERTREVDIRVIAATNRDLQKEVAKGNFREDLYFRLNVFPVECAPLRDRRDDIPVLADHFLKIACSRLNIASPVLTRANIVELKAYSWPGNARELQNLIERAAILARNGRMQFSLNAPPQAAISPPSPAPRQLGDEILTRNQILELERQNIRRALDLADGRVSGAKGAAELLGMRPTTLYSRIKALEL
ncbi:sigma 54-interacting transcriptional regulator [Pelagibacterium halotolerans]|uniref:Formate hydrogenlyase transcriptional activator n=1 Tax=Pelagibacterium halotolerans (strain DSM 22347 / JCM 15775 / CGMCC 1.7692 / B2) TaxID=1082931 RepID=G4R8F1_PELHB|nr:sigma 54-interacting transcriptional regulator [Pelagibacterium halotolerans]AEQ52395.1 formate hydrogenlyase transcriptional activator [Pelagibacterium halotolerans B2]QJR17873.1 sigma 54-interacting transcriptional regulator [Pelagibacterium halotolerans]SEA35163.1 PAS domain S-box-containing protein [Pelagibacterium halotolerans]